MVSDLLKVSSEDKLAEKVAASFSQKVVKLGNPSERSSVGNSFQESMHNLGQSAEDLAPSNWLEMMAAGISPYLCGKAVLDYCLSQDNIRAFVFFSMEDDLILSLISIIASEQNLQLVYASNLNLSRIGALNLIEHCYGDKAFFTEQIREKMTRERFARSTKAFILVYELKQSLEKVIELKARLRKTLPAATFERRIHGTDGVNDTTYLVELITNPNSLFLINRVRISRRDSLLNRLPTSLRGNPNVCVDGSAAMELYGLRKSRDFDLICAGTSLKKEILEQNYDVNNDHYKSLPISHLDVINSPYLHVRIYGTKFTSLATRQLLLSFGPRSHQASWGSKKMRDIELIASFYLEKQSSYIFVLAKLSTFITQLRLIFEFFVNRLMPKLPPSLAKFIRRVRGKLLSR